jgi:hydroxymethylbilane synthase
MKTKLKIGTRGSRLALAQTELVCESLKGIHPGIILEITTYKTQGDKRFDLPFSATSGKALFTKELEEALLKKEIDLAVHSAKDLYADLEKGLILGPVPLRENPADIFISHEHRTLKELPAGSRIGTSSLRRRAQLRILNPNWQIAELRGNVDTRLRKLEEGFYEGIVLAAAGIKRLGLIEEWPNHEILSEKEFLPAPCQGALALEIREGDKETAEILAPLNHLDSQKKVLAERAFMRTLQAGCQIPAGITSTVQEGQLTLIGALFSTDGKEAIRWSTLGDKNTPEAVGEQLAEWLLNAGGRELLEKVRNEKK